MLIDGIRCVITENVAKYPENIVHAEPGFGAD